jgi:hypothetical protein
MAIHTLTFFSVLYSGLNARRPAQSLKYLPAISSASLQKY